MPTAQQTIFPAASNLSEATPLVAARELKRKEKSMRPTIRLGDVAKDSITGYSGVVVAITEWLNGCQRITIQTRELKDGKPVESVTFDAEQIEVVEPKAQPAVSPSGGPSIAPTRAKDPK